MYAKPILYLCVLYVSVRNSGLWFLQDKLIGFYDIGLKHYNPVVTI